MQIVVEMQQVDIKDEGAEDKIIESMFGFNNVVRIGRIIRIWGNTATFVCYSL